MKGKRLLLAFRPSERNKEVATSDFPAVPHMPVFVDHLTMFKMHQPLPWTVQAIEITPSKKTLKKRLQSLALKAWEVSKTRILYILSRTYERREL